MGAGCWLPVTTVRAVRRRYRGGTLVLETEFETADGRVAVIDCMPGRGRRPNLVRVVEGRRGTVPMHMELVLRSDYGAIVPWLQHTDSGVWAIAGPDAFRLHSAVPLHRRDLTSVADFTVAAGQRQAFTLGWHPSHEEAPAPIDPGQACGRRRRGGRSGRAAAPTRGRGGGRGALLDHPQGLDLRADRRYRRRGHDLSAGAARWGTQLGLPLLLAPRRHLHPLRAAERWLSGGSTGVASWLLRAVAGRPAATNIMYGLAGERRLPELELDWLPGYEESRPVRIGNAASRQFQLDVYGEVLDSMYQSRRSARNRRKPAGGWSRRW